MTMKIIKWQFSTLKKKIWVSNRKKDKTLKQDPRMLGLMVGWLDGWNMYLP